MSFRVKEHVIPAQHVRELPDALAIDETRQDATLQLHVKQYTPKNNSDPQPGDTTIIAFHGNGFCKEIYEPVWEHLLATLPPNRRVRSIWIADVAHQGSSYLLNESKLGLGIAWDDHARDILHMVNYFRKEMPPPLMGVGHSMGSVVMVKLADIHPRLFHSVALLDPWIWTHYNASPQPPHNTIKQILFKKDTFASAEIATKNLRNHEFFKNWDPRSLQIYLDHRLRPTPTLLHHGQQNIRGAPSNNSNEQASTTHFTLRTPKEMEAVTLFRPNPYALNANSNSTRVERLAMPYVNYGSPLKAPVSNPNTKDVVTHLQTLRPRCLFLYGTKSPVNSLRDGADVDRQRNLDITGRGSGGSGGVPLGCVAEDWIEGAHAFPLENPTDLGKRLATWVDQEANIWQLERQEVQSLLWHGRDGVKERQELDPTYIKVMKGWNGKGWVEPEDDMLADDLVEPRNIQENEVVQKAKAKL